MRLKLEWKTHPKHKKTVILGAHRELPDSHCSFSIIKMSENAFWALLPAYGSNMNMRMIFRDPETARDFCEDYLNYNCLEIIRHQIKEMKRCSLKTDKTVGHYEKMKMEYQKVNAMHSAITPMDLAS